MQKINIKNNKRDIPHDNLRILFIFLNLRELKKKKKSQKTFSTIKND